jgi:hypothetical protein
MAKTTTASEKRRRFVFVAGQKSARKTTTALLLADLYRASGKLVHFYDADDANGTFLARHGSKDENTKEPLATQDPAVGCGYYGTGIEGSRDMFLNCIDVDPLPDVIFTDTGARSLEHLKSIVGFGDSVTGLVEGIKDAGFDITIVHPIIQSKVTTSSLKQYMDAFGSDVDYVAVIHTKPGHKVGTLNKPSTDAGNQNSWGQTSFQWWFGRVNPDTGNNVGYKTRDHFLSIGGREIVISELKDDVYSVFEATNLTFKDAAESKQFNMAERRNIMVFNKAAGEALMQVSDVLGLD